MREFLRKLLPKRHEVTQHWSIKPWAHVLNHPRHWHIHRIGVARAVFIGLACAWSPLPGTQMPMAAVWACAAKANIPAAILATWITNPITILPFYFAAFVTGNAVLTLTVPAWESIAFSLDGLWSKHSVLIPMLIGCFIIGVPTAFSGFFLTKYLWRQHIRAKLRKRQRRQRTSVAAT